MWLLTGDVAAVVMLAVAVLVMRLQSTATFTGPQGVDQATAALKALHSRPCDVLGGHVLNCKYAKLEPDEADGLPQVSSGCS
jgi:hypothetical protein